MFYSNKHSRLCFSTTSKSRNIYIYKTNKTVEFGVQEDDCLER